MLTAASSTGAKTGTQPQGPAVEDGGGDVVHLQSGASFSNEKQGDPDTGTTWKNREDILLIHVSQSQKHRYCMISLV